MWPSLRRIMPGRKALVTQNSASTLTLNVRSICSLLVSRNGLPLTTPALFTRMSMSPTASVTAAATAATAFWSLTSQT